MLSEIIYKKAVDGTVHSWQYEVEDDRRRAITGTMNGKKTVSSWRTCQPKNLGKKNATTGPEQALAEAEADMKKRLDREYRRTIEELEFVPKGPMLAQKWEDVDVSGHEMFAMQPKLDGIRALITRHGAFTRDFQPHKNAGHIREALEPFFERFPDLVFDGELYNHRLKDDFNEISSLVRREKLDERQKEKVVSLVEFHCYDIAGDGYAEKPFEARNDIRGDLSEHPDWGGPLVNVDTVIGDRRRLDEHYAWCADEGYEGQMVRLLDSVYEYDNRVKGLIKRKEFVTDEFKIIRVEEGVGNWAGCAKRLRFDFNGIENGAGIRGTRPQMKKILSEWQDWDLEKAVATVRYFKQLTPDGKARFATVVDFHPEGRKD